MSTQATYTPEEWKTITSAPVMAGLLVSMADLSGPIGIAREGLAIVKGVADTAGTTSNELIKTLAEGIKSGGIRPDLPSFSNDPASARAALIDGCKQAAAVVTQKSPAEAEEFKRWLVSLAHRTAEAVKEGGFLGVGGTLVSDAEGTSVRELASALGVNP